MIDLNKFIKSVYAEVPIIKNNFIYNRKKYTVNNVDDGWYGVTLQNNNATIVESIVPEVTLKIDKKYIIKGYTYHNSLLFFNFNEGKKRTGWEIMAPLRLNTQSTFSSIDAIKWEDGFLYFYRPSYTDSNIFELKNMFDNSESIKDKKGLTPEQKSLYLFHLVEQEQQKALIKRLEEERLIEEKKQQFKTAFDQEQQRKARESVSIEEGLINSFAAVGAKIIKFQIRQDRIHVNWLINEDEEFSSIVDKNTYRIIEAGFCMSGDDRRHNVKSMVITAKDYIDRDVLHKW